MINRIFSLSLVVAMSLPVLAENRTINLDLQPGPSGHRYAADFHGTGWLPGVEGETWNMVAPPVRGYASSWGSGGLFDFEEAFNSEPLVDSTGMPTPVTVTVYRGEPHGTTFAVSPSNLWAYQHIATNAQNLMSDYVIIPGNGTNRIVIQGLIPGSAYSLALFGAGDQNTHQTRFIVGGIEKSTSGVPHDRHPMTEGSDYVILDGVVSEDGSLTIFYTGAGSSRDGNFNGFQLHGPFAADAPDAAVGETLP